MVLTQLFLLIAILAFAAVVGVYQIRDQLVQPARGEISKIDRRFLRQAATVAAAEVALSELALQVSRTALVQHLAKRIVDDHAQVNKKLASLAWRYRVNVSVQPSVEVLRKTRQLHELRGHAFDCAYDEAIVADHRKAIDLFAVASRSDNLDIRRLAEATLPMLDLHLKMAKDLEPSSAPGPFMPPM